MYQFVVYDINETISMKFCNQYIYIYILIAINIYHPLISVLHLLHRDS
jgi:hypothetical protein